MVTDAVYEYTILNIKFKCMICQNNSAKQQRIQDIELWGEHIQKEYYELLSLLELHEILFALDIRRSTILSAIDLCGIFT